MSSTRTIFFIADFFSEDLVGGGELNNEEAIKILSKKHKVIKRRSHTVDLPFLLRNKDGFFIIGNFINIKQDCLNYLTECCKYIIYEHDHKYVRNRNPAVFNDFMAPKDFIVNLKFYQNAKKVIAQSSLHKSIIDKNLNTNNVVNFSGNLWSDEILDHIEILNWAQLSKKSKKAAILNSNTPHKNTIGAIDYCKKNNLEYELIASNDNKEFLSLLSVHDRLVFLPQTPETLSRICVEAKMLGLKVVTTKLTGAASEPWFAKPAADIINYMYERKDYFLSLIEEEL